jgi:hypothetical protein
MLFKEIIAVYCANHTKPVSTKYSVNDCYSIRYIWLPLGIKGLNLLRTYKHPPTSTDTV